ncbi:MAG: hypothetical protein RBR77_12820 [Thauera sp.]|nr:hypothetical protein [Thauera sp.]
MPWPSPSLTVSTSLSRTLRRKLLLLGKRLCLLALPLSLSSAPTGVAMANDSEPTGGARRAAPPQELRTLLSTSHELEPRQNATRRLDPVERQAIRRDIREAMRGAYPEQNPSAGQPSKAQPSAVPASRLQRR